MLLPKEMIVGQLRARDDWAGVERADRELGEKVDTGRDAELLAQAADRSRQLDDQFGGQSPAVG
jgi:hypothetical protein